MISGAAATTRGPPTCVATARRTPKTSSEVTPAATAFATAGVCAAAMLAPAPAPVVPVVAVFCVLVPMVAAWELRAAISTLRHRAPLSEARAIAGLRRGLAELPEIEHPLGL